MVEGVPYSRIPFFSVMVSACEFLFAALSTEQRAVVVLHHYVGLGLDEIASIVGVPAGTARSRLHYALQKLRAALEPVETATPAVAESGR